MATAIVVNGTHIVPDGFPTSFRPDQLDKLGLTGAITLGWPTIVGGIALMFGARNWRQYSYTPLAIVWMWSVSLVAFGIFSRFGVFDHLIVFCAVVHIQAEWLIITYLLGHSFAHGYLNATLVGLIIYLSEVALPGIRGTFSVTSIVGAFGDVFIPVLLWHGHRKILAVGGIAHFLNAVVTFIEFVHYIPVEAYLSLQVIFGTAHAAFTVFGIMEVRNGSAIRLSSSDSERDYGRGMHRRADSYDGLYKPLIPVPDKEETIKLVILALVLSLAASLTVNFVRL